MISLSVSEGRTNSLLIEKTINLSVENSLVRIYEGNNYEANTKELEVVISNPGKWNDIITPRNKLSNLSKMNIDYSVLIWDYDLYSNSHRGDYHSLTEMEDFLFDISINYPDITSLYSIGKSHEGRDRNY